MIIFVKTRYEYQSYTDYWKLVKLSKFPTIYVDELDVSQDGIYIISPMNGEWRDHIDNQSDKPRNAHLIHWCLERPALSAGSVGQYAASNRELQAKRQIDDVWISDAALAHEIGQEFVVLGSDKGLMVSGDNTKKYNFCHLSYETDRRKRIYNQFDSDTIGPNCWEPERSSVLRQSRFGLAVHQDNHPYMEPLRFALFAAYALPILSETIYESFPFTDEHILKVGYDKLGQRMNELLGDSYSHWQEMGRRAKELLCVEYNFKQMVEEKVRNSIGWR